MFKNLCPQVQQQSTGQKITLFPTNIIRDGYRLREVSALAEITANNYAYLTGYFASMFDRDVTTELKLNYTGAANPEQNVLFDYGAKLTSFYVQCNYKLQSTAGAGALVGKIQISDDGTTWTTLQTTNCGDGTTVSNSYSGNVSFRYLRYWAQGAASPGGNNFYLSVIEHFVGKEVTE